MRGPTRPLPPPTGAVPAVDGNLVAHLESLARAGGWLDDTAYIEDAEHLTYRRLFDAGAGTASALAGLGVRPGDRVLLALPDGIDFVTAFLGVLRLGAVAIPVNTLFHESELRRSEKIAEPVLVVCRDEARQTFTGKAVTPLDLRTHIGGPRPAPHPVEPGAIAFAAFTSGTTGAPKLCFHAHGDAAVFDRAIGSALRITRDDVCYSVSRMYFAYGLGNSILLPLQRGARTVLTAERADEHTALTTLAAHHVTVFYGQPSFYARLLSHPDHHRLRTLRAAAVAGELLPHPVEDALRALLGDRLLNICGTTEIGHAVLANGPEAPRPGTVGRVLDPYRVRVVDDTGTPLPAGTEGRLQIAGPTIGDGVRRGSAPPIRLTPEEWYATGDAALIDDDGYVSLLGRLDDIEIVAGANVHPAEVEDRLGRDPRVREIVVCSVSRASRVTSLRAYVAAEDGADQEELRTSLLATAARELTWYKVPEDVVFVTTLPRNPTGKLLRRALRASGPAQEEPLVR
ncbi:class I adenylate-forming enzyme family protein [Streptomyces sp. NPDC048305]|uniref:class I adenylate-forming enzyme family protein n=1 Tax=Streptomyces sp. NPDC048305 TaxID=3365532 RepID=UPI003710273F